MFPELPGHCYMRREPEADTSLRLSSSHLKSRSLETELRTELDDTRRLGSSHLAEIGAAVRC